jgi:protoporphyrinogen oxidase
MATSEAYDLIVAGAGQRGLAAALAWRQTHPTASLLVLDSAPWPGGSLRTQRTNGYVCELGPFAFAAAELAPLLRLLGRAPTPIACLPSAAHGARFDGERLAAVAVPEPPVAFRSGNEELAQACRRELGTALRLGRAITAIDGAGDGFTIELGGEVPTSLQARQMVMALPCRTAGQLLGRFDPALAAAAARVRTEPRAFAFFGGDATAAPELTGYGVVPADDLPTAMAEAIYCSQVFANRALPGRFLVRCEVAVAEAASDDEVLALAAAELRRWTGTRAPFGLQKLHRFEVEVADGALAEVRQRLAALPMRVPGLHWA